ncbi:MAG: UDP-3-O-(3-hydroxymyristoyl)glucosamine N-acyltransferase [Bacteroidota bacterium]
MKKVIGDIAQLVNGVVEGDDALFITHPDKIEYAKKGAISFLANDKYEPFLYTTEASAVLVDKNFQPKETLQSTLIRVDNVYVALQQLLTWFEQTSHPERTISPLAFVSKTAKIGTNTAIGAFSSIEEAAEIGDNCLIYTQVFIGKEVKIGHNVCIYPGVKIYHHCEIGDNCILHANAVIGSDGFGFAPKSDGTFQKIPQVGKVVIEDNVEIGANTVIDRATMGATLIRKGTKLDNLIQVAHNVTIGENTVIAAQAGVAGSTEIGNQCQVGGQAGFVGHIHIADGTRVQAQSGVTKSIKQPNSKIYGYPAINYQDYLRAYALFRRLPDLEKRIRQLEKKEK